ncbi:hypothetical protein SAMN06265368_3172 [Cohaesibacter gelatinilyticus]|uniref:Uncharacterized protein n=2 Tax=Cohaesibacter gelatinilyticus TaxID=372072 RepID=A0A285PFJ2_9HYPH|nr:hypothetical protein SAMN06265368_3172 [Cohaesibacter gelatinilyticus]
MILTRYFVCAISLYALIFPIEAGAEDNAGSYLIEGTYNLQATNCVAFVKDQRSLAAENGMVLSRAEQKNLLHQCRNSELEAIIAEQEHVLAALDEEIKAIQLEIDENGQIIDENGRAIAKIVAINGQLIIRKQLEAEIAETEARIAALEADTEAKLAEAERILQRLATQ